MSKKISLRPQRAYIMQDVSTGNVKEKVIVVGRSPRGKVLFHYPKQTCVHSCPVRAIKGPYYIGGKPQA